jgi:asparagine synthase (glutamine-hydrolysing)
MLAAMHYERDCVTGTACTPALGVYAGWVQRAGSVAARQCATADQDGRRLLLNGECVGTSGKSGARRASYDAAGRGDEWTLLDAYADAGDAFIAELNGLFSGLLIDPRRSVVLLFNDRYGSERIYWHEREGVTYFASEAKALLAVLPELRAFDDRGVADYLAFGSTLGHRTLFRGVAMLPGASLWSFGPDGRNVRKGCYFDPAQWEAQPALDAPAFSAAFAETFKRVLPRYLTTTPQIGISLTGGLDTRMIMACLPPDRVPPLSYTYAGPDGETLDCRLGERLAQLRGLGHHKLRIGGDFLQNYGKYVDRTVYVTDGCAGALGAHELYFSALARQLAPIRLTGNFGSEVLRGMSIFKPVGLADAMLDRGFKPLVSMAVREATAGDVHPVTHAAFREVPWHLFGALAAARSQLTFRTPYLDNEIVELAFRAPPEMRRSPGPALRLIDANHHQMAEIPTDRGLVPAAARTSPLLRQLYAALTFKLDYLHKEGMPDWLSPLDAAFGSLSALGLLGLHKFLPYRGWFRRELSPYLRDVVGDAQTRRLPYWNARFLSSVLPEHVRGRRNRLRELNAIVTLEAVDRLFIRNSTTGAANRVVH